MHDSGFRPFHVGHLRLAYGYAALSAFINASICFLEIYCCVNANELIGAAISFSQAIPTYGLATGTTSP